MIDEMRPGVDSRFALQIDAYVYERVESGNFSEGAGSDLCDEGWACLVEGPLVQEDRETNLTKYEIDFLKDRAGCIVRESPDGTIAVEYYADKKRLDQAWASTIQDVDPVI